jgi:hypothetical protein
LKKSAVFGDLRVIDMYESAILSDKPLRDRQGNWVQKYQEPDDAALFATAQFSRYQEVEAFVKENLSDSRKIARRLRQGGA